jgi:transcriptional regulator with XRE-family HTH domain
MQTVGENIRLARLRRGFSMELVTDRAGMSRTTLSSVEKGEPGVTFGTYVNVLYILGLHQDILLLAKDDELGRKLQDFKFPQRKRSPNRTTT